MPPGAMMPKRRETHHAARWAGRGPGRQDRQSKQSEKQSKFTSKTFNTVVNDAAVKLRMGNPTCQAK